MSFQIRLAKESFKFSASHFTIFGPGESERLHGHNYYVAAEIGIRQLRADIGMAFDFNLVKPVLARICKELDEYVLLAGTSDYLKFQEAESSVTVSFAKKVYSFPVEDVKILPVCNVTSEELAVWIGQKFQDELSKLIAHVVITDLAISVEETRGQCVVWRAEPPAQGGV